MMQFGALPSGWRPTALVRPGLFRSVSRRVPFAALGMGLNGVLTALALPWLMPWLNTLLPGT